MICPVIVRLYNISVLHDSYIFQLLRVWEVTITIQINIQFTIIFCIIRWSLCLVNNLKLKSHIFSSKKFSRWAIPCFNCRRRGTFQFNLWFWKFRIEIYILICCNLSLFVYIIKSFYFIKEIINIRRIIYQSCRYRFFMLTINISCNYYRIPAFCKIHQFIFYFFRNIISRTTNWANSSTCSWIFFPHRSGCLLTSIRDIIMIHQAL